MDDFDLLIATLNQTTGLSMSRDWDGSQRARQINTRPLLFSESARRPLHIMIGHSGWALFMLMRGHGTKT